MEESNQRPLMYVAMHATDDPTLATLPFLVATGAGSAEIDCCIRNSERRSLIQSASPRWLLSVALSRSSRVAIVH